MTDAQLINILYKQIEQGDCFTKEIQSILVEYRDSGGKQKVAQKLVERIAFDYSGNETFQDRAYDILDIITGWCNSEMTVWGKQKTENLVDDLRFEDDEMGVVFNHFSFCELVKHIMIKYGKIDYKLANKKLNESDLIKVPGSVDDVVFLSHELEFHWAMLLVHGNMYWTKGIPCDYNEFKEEYSEWEKDIKRKYNLKASYEYYWVRK